MRGLPACGKTTRANELLEESGFVGVICSADEYFMEETQYGCRYVFDPYLLGKAHEWCQDYAEESMHHKTPLIIIDNTNVRRGRIIKDT